MGGALPASGDFYGDITPDFSVAQAWFQSAPSGLGIVDIPGWWLLTGGVTVGVVDASWYRSHEDLVAIENEGRMLAVGASSGAGPVHGTAVLSVLGAWRNTVNDPYGLIGSVPRASFVFARHGTTNSPAQAIRDARGQLGAGDVLLIERQFCFTGVSCGHPVELDPAVRAEVRRAVASGIHVVVPSGNGGFDLDDASLYGDWFARTPARDSGAIFVGAGNTPRPSGRTTAARSYRAGCYGDRVDLQGWGGDVVTAASGSVLKDLFTYPKSGANDDREGYSLNFGNTSAASAVVTGVVALASAFAFRMTGSHLSPRDLRDALVASGAPQERILGRAGPLRQIGPQPAAPALFASVRQHLVAKSSVTVPVLPSGPTMLAQELLRLRAFGLTGAEAAHLIGDSGGGTTEAVALSAHKSLETLVGADPLRWAALAQARGLVP